MCNFFQKSDPRNIDKSVSDIQIRIRFLFVSCFGLKAVFGYPYPFANLLSCRISYRQTRDEHWTGLGLDWIRTIANFVKFGSDQDCKSLPNLGTRLDLDWVNAKEMQHFCCEKTEFFQYFGLRLRHLKLDLDWVLKILYWIWIAKFGSPLMSGSLLVHFCHAWRHFLTAFPRCLA